MFSDEATTYWDDDKRRGVHKDNLCPKCPVYRPDEPPNEREREDWGGVRPYCAPCRRQYQNDRRKAELGHGTAQMVSQPLAAHNDYKKGMCPRCDYVRPRETAAGYCTQCRREYQRLRSQARKAEQAELAERIERLAVQEREAHEERIRERLANDPIYTPPDWFRNEYD